MSRTRIARAAFVAGFASAVWTAPQQGQSPPAPAQSRPAPVIGVSVELVQVDAIVTDAKGRHVMDLCPDGFEVVEDGQKQAISQCEYVRMGVSAAGPARPTPSLVAPMPASGVARSGALQREDVRRTIAIVVDDVNLSFRGVIEARDAVHRFLSTRTAPGDLLAILRTSGGSGPLQQFTDDPRVLEAAVQRLRFSPRLGGALGDEGLADDPSISAEALDDWRGRWASGTFGLLRDVVRRLQALPGRRALVLISDGSAIAFQSPNGFPHPDALAALDRLVDLANRSHVVIYTLDNRGMATGAIQAEMGLKELGASHGGSGGAQEGLAQNVHRATAEIGQDRLQQEDDLAALAGRTGGLFIRASNDLPGALGEAVDDQQGYYLIGYPLNSGTYPRTTRPKFHRIRLRAKRSGLHVRARTGYLDSTAPPEEPPPGSAGQEILAAALSPFPATGVTLRAVSVVERAGAKGYRIDTQWHVDAADLSLDDCGDGRCHGQVEVATVLFDEKGLVPTTAPKRYSFSVPLEGRELWRHTGFVVHSAVPVARPGAYRFRAAVRDRASGRTGTTEQFIEIPDLSRHRAALLGLIVAGADEARGALARDATEEGRGTHSKVDASPAVRHFATGSDLVWNATFYHPTRDRTTGAPHLRVQVRVRQDGREVVAVAPMDVDTATNSDPESVRLAGRLRLPATLGPGAYDLELAVIDSLADKARRVAQVTDFEIVQREDRR